MIRFGVLLFSIFFLSSCVSLSEVKPNTEKPNWLKNINNLNSSYAVGSSPVNFQGIYIQRNEAIDEAKNDLAHNIETHIKSVYESKVIDTKFNNSFKSLQKIKSLSNIFLRQSYQVDAFFDEDKRLYILMKIPSKEKIKLKDLKTKPFKNDKLLKSRCYGKNILESIDTKSPLYNDKPFWFYRPNSDGKTGAVGIAEREDGINFFKQKDIAYTLAKAELSKNSTTKIISEYDLISVLNDELSAERFESASAQKSSSKLKEFHIEDIWLDPKSCELYIYLLVD